MNRLTFAQVGRLGHLSDQDCLEHDLLEQEQYKLDLEQHHYIIKQ